ncbi:tyrosine-type recombinase/integrase [Gottfriedia acidiceleris]|uniref:Site-specific integrase n=1 Tax=Gottfriedia acidiceleris TaxID=371036 RepID=A0ABY4JF10_9BACI|nr:site-specific integrase [Gottfriedia acidiceleris]UPM52441.1 site-specific integrase [Gottfriedia acidiceleris]
MSYQSINSKSTVEEYLQVFLEFRKNAYSKNTTKSYNADVLNFIKYTQDQGIETVTVSEFENVEIVHGWIEHQINKNDAYSTVQRRKQSLSTFVGVLKSRGILKSNEFVIYKLKKQLSGQHSRTLSIGEMTELYNGMNRLSEQKGEHCEITLKMLLFTGLRNESLGYIKVKHIDFEKGYLKFCPTEINYKNRIRNIPLPKLFLVKLESYIKKSGLCKEDFICTGMNSMRIKNKMLNFLTNELGEIVGWRNEGAWNDDKHFTPHGFRTSVATFFSEQNIPKNHIQFWLGHIKDESNTDSYLRACNASYRAIKKAINTLENILENVESDESCPIHDDIYPNESSTVSSTSTIQLKSFLSGYGYLTQEQEEAFLYYLTNTN